MKTLAASQRKAWIKPFGPTNEVVLPVLEMLLDAVPFVSPAAALAAQAAAERLGAQPGRPRRKSWKLWKVSTPVAKLPLF
jgi:hypothetical protein